MNLYVTIVVTYLHCLGVWLHFIYNLGKSMEEIGAISNY